MNDISAGSRVKMDIREDEEQDIKCQEVMELFLTAGYFRARIKVQYNVSIQYVVSFDLIILAKYKMN
jgi:hypothetical protein